MADSLSTDVPQTTDASAYSACFSSPIGPLTVTCSATHVLRVDFGDKSGAMPDSSKAAAALADATIDQLREYFAAQRQAFALPAALPGLPGMPAAHSFRHRAQAGLTDIPYGVRWTYRQLAEVAGSPGAARAAGTACARNPVPIIVPCHRVVPAGGGVGNYRGGAQVKRWLLDFEARNLAGRLAVQ